MGERPQVPAKDAWLCATICCRVHSCLSIAHVWKIDRPACRSPRPFEPAGGTGILDCAFVATRNSHRQECRRHLSAVYFVDISLDEENRVARHRENLLCFVCQLSHRLGPTASAPRVGWSQSSPEARGFVHATARLSASVH